MARLLASLLAIVLMAGCVKHASRVPYQNQPWQGTGMIRIMSTAGFTRFNESLNVSTNGMFNQACSAEGVNSWSVEKNQLGQCSASSLGAVPESHQPEMARATAEDMLCDSMSPGSRATVTHWCIAPPTPTAWTMSRPRFTCTMAIDYNKTTGIYTWISCPDSIQPSASDSN